MNITKEQLEVRKQLSGRDDLCPDCGGIGYTDCPNRLCNGGRVNISEETLAAAEKEIAEIVKTKCFEKEHELAIRTGIRWNKIASIREKMRGPCVLDYRGNRAVCMGRMLELTPEMKAKTIAGPHTGVREFIG